MAKKQDETMVPRSRPPQALATPQEVADYLRKPVKTLTEWRYRSIGPAYHRSGRDVRYDWDDVFQWLAEQRRETTDTPRPAA